MEQIHDILVLIPAYNESTRIGPVITAAQQFLPVLVVDDGSVDETELVTKTSGTDVLRQVPNQGKGAALRAGFKKAIADGYAAVITLDADGQHDPAEIPLFIEEYRSRNADLIIGARNFQQMPLTRKLANSLGRVIFSWAIGTNIRDNQSGYRLISRRLMESLLESSENGFEFEVEMIQVCLKNNWPLGWVPIRTIYADQGSHIRPGKHVANFFRIVSKTRREMRNKGRQVTGA